MNCKKLVFIIVLGGLTSSLAGMERALQEMKISDDIISADIIKIQLKDGKTDISPETFNTLKEASITLQAMEQDIDSKEITSLVLPSIDTAQLDLVLDSIEAINAGTIEDFLVALNQKDRKKLLSLIDAANYLDIKAIMGLVAEAMDSFKSVLEKRNLRASKSKLDLVKALLIPKFIKLYKIDLNKGDRNGWTELIWAAERGHKDIVELLIAAGADLDKQTENGRTALISAVERGHKDIVELLIGAGADLDKQRQNGCTALISAVERGHKDIVELLIGAGADLDKEGGSGWTALRWAVFKGYKDIIELLKEAGAK